ncbi:MAG: HD domain-containing protein [Opitutales bacterium]|nr:HD domain-containing protein [Opitutales bacterium]
MYDIISTLDLKSAPEGSRFSTAIMVLSVDSKTSAKNNAEYLDVKVGDKNSNFSCKIFGSSPVFNLFKTVKGGTVILLEGITKQYNGTFSPEITFAKELSDKEIAEGDFEKKLLNCATEGCSSLKDDLEKIINTVSNPTLRQVIIDIFNEIEEPFDRKPAGTSMHHAYRNGLLEHTVHAAKAGQSLLPLYPFIDYDLAIAGLVLHDIGKVFEYDDEMVAQKTKIGILQGHLVIGYRIVRRVALQNKLDDSLLERLEHILLSHHDLPEYGAAVRPATPEAFFVALVDNLDAKMGMVEQLLKATPECNVFSDRHFGLDAKILVEKVVHK